MRDAEKVCGEIDRQLERLSANIAEMVTVATMAKEERVKVVCAWCGGVLKAGSDKQVSHGICPACKDAVLNGTHPMCK